MINPNPSTISEILKSDCQFHIPQYQREFAWGKGEALDFWDDLETYMETENHLFLGTIIFDVADQDNKRISIVDGQQRITTILLLLIVCRNIAISINATQMATKIQEKITFTSETTGLHIGGRLISSSSIREIFTHISDYSWDGLFPLKINNKSMKRQINRIKPIYDYFYSQLQDYDQVKLTRFLETIYRAYVVRIDIKDEIEALSIFERTNARGLDLEASDLLKNHLFANGQGIEDLEEKWSQIVENSNGTLLRMLKYFYVSKNGYVNKSVLYKAIKNYGRTVGTDKLVQELDDFARYYSVIRSGNSSDLRAFFESIGCEKISNYVDRYEKIYSSIEGLRLFKISQTYPLIYSAIGCFVRTGSTKYSLLIELFDILEKYHFINNAICERIGNEVEKPYADFSQEYQTSEDFEITTKALVEMLKIKLAGPEEFSSRFTDLLYSSTTIGIISYIFDRINNFGLEPGARVRIFNPDQKVLRKNHSIEHFYPQNPEDGTRPLEPEYINNIGNLLSICFKTNSKLSNLDPSQKIEKLQSELLPEIQNLTHVRDFIQKYGSDAGCWDKDKIQNRALDLAREAYTKMWKV